MSRSFILNQKVSGRLESVSGVKLKLLRALDEAGAPLSFKEVAARAGVPLASTLGHLRALERAGSVKRTPGEVVTFEITERGGSLLGPTISREEAERLLVRVPPENAFLFYRDVGVSAGRSASSLAEFASILQELEEESIEFHLRRGDFERWISFIGDQQLSSKLSEIKGLGISGADLRNRLREAVKSRVDELERATSK
jgi:DNA-binding MarR family transcriptional regulator